MIGPQEALVLDWRLELIRARVHRDHGNAHFLTTITRLRDQVPAEEITEYLSVSQSQVLRWAAQRRELLFVVQGGKPGWTAYHAAEQYHQGKISRTQLVDALISWISDPPVAGNASISSGRLSVVEEVRVTRLDGMIDDALCETLYVAIAGL